MSLWKLYIKSEAEESLSNYRRILKEDNYHVMTSDDKDSIIIKYDNNEYKNEYKNVPEILKNIYSWISIVFKISEPISIHK